MSSAQRGGGGSASATRFTSATTTTQASVISSNGQAVSTVYVTSVGTTTSTTKPSTDTSSGNHTGAIVGGVVGGIVALVVICLLILFCIRRNKNKDDFDGNFDPDRVVGHSTGGGTLPQIDLGDEEAAAATPYAYNPSHGGMSEYGGSSGYPVTAAAAAMGAGPRSGGSSSPSQYPSSEEQYHNNAPTSPTTQTHQPMSSISSGSNYAPYGALPPGAGRAASPAPGQLLYNNPPSSKEQEAQAARYASRNRLGLATQPDDVASPRMSLGRGGSGQGSIGSGSVVVHQDGGRVQVPQHDHEPPSEIPPTYDSIPADDRASDDVSLVDLYQVALVCKSFCEPALDVLWGKEWMDLADLVNCLPVDSLVFEPSGGVALININKLTLKDIGRFHSYAGRIRKLAMPNRRAIYPILPYPHSDYTGCERIHFATQGALEAFTSSAIVSKDISIFPRLTHFHGYYTDITSMNYLKWFIGPKLCAIDITLNGSPASDTIAILDSIKSRSPNLRQLSFNSDGKNKRKLRRYLSAVIETFQGLQKFSSTLKASEDVLSMLGRLPTLRTLELYLAEIDSPKFPAEDFRRLEEARLSAHSMDSATAFIKRTQAPPIRTIYVQVDVQPSMTVLGKFSKALLKHSSRDVLESVELSLTNERHSGILDPRAISPLFKFKNMREFTLVLHYSLECVDDVFFAGMVHSWPQLNRLSMAFTNMGPLPTSVTLDGLRALSSCPHLSQIELAMDATIDTLPSTKMPCSNILRTLDFGYSKISNPYTAAALLSEMFPNLSTVSSGWTDYPGYLDDEEGDLWVQCEAAYPLFIELRERQRDLLASVLSNRGSSTGLQRDPPPYDPARLSALIDYGRLTPKDVERFHSYAGRIRKLRMPYDSIFRSVRNGGGRRGIRTHFAAREDIKAITSSTIVSKDHSFLPKLSHVQWSDTSNASLSYLEWFIGPLLRDFEIDLQDSLEADCIVILNFIKLRSPNLQRLKINGNTTENLARSLSVATDAWQGLQVFQSGIEAGEDLISALGRLQVLRTLHLCLAETAPINPLPVQFRRLETAHLFAQSMDTVTVYMRRIQAPLIRDIHIHVAVQPPMTALKQFSDVLLKQCPQDILESVELSLSDIYSGDQGALDPRAVSPLLKFKGMRNFILSLNFSLERLDNAFFQEMAHSWPQLQRLSITYLNNHGPLPTSITLDGLHALSACPRLTTIALAMDARIGTLPLVEKACSNILRSLDFGYSKISNSYALAALLSEMFPNLGTIRSGWTGFHEYFVDDADTERKLWAECEAVYPWFIQLQERQRELQVCTVSNGSTASMIHGNDVCDRL
ncbi:hypothetical protein HWV62_27166 [Athelia sp. TMB]|nr:hypothetical protein HWV62_27166 [Athelia sp. TMB]